MNGSDELVGLGLKGSVERSKELLRGDVEVDFTGSAAGGRDGDWGGDLS